MSSDARAEPENQAPEQPRLIPPGSAYYIMGVDGPDPSTPVDWLDTRAGLLTRDDDLLQIAYGTCVVDGETFIAFGFPPQHVAEDPAGEDQAAPNTTPFVYAAVGGGPAAPQEFRDGNPKITGKIQDWWGAMPWTHGTRLVFNVPSGAPDPVGGKLTPAQLLDWSRWRLCVRPRAVSNETLARVRTPANGALFAGVTEAADDAGSQLAMAFGLVLAQTDTGGWTHLDAPLTLNGRTELWHTRLAPSGGRAPAVRAIRSLRNFIGKDPTFYSGLDVVPEFDRYYPHPLPAEPADTVSEWHRQIDTPLTSFAPPDGSTLAKDLVAVTSGFDGPPPLEMAAEATLLSALGGSTRIAMQVPQSDIASVALRAWSHEQRFGRDQASHSDAVAAFVPFGHRILISIALFRTIDGSGPASLRKQITVRFLETARTYATRDMAQPFGAVTILQTTPAVVYEFPMTTVFYDDPAMTRPHMVNLVATDASGAAVQFAHPLMWEPVDAVLPYNAPSISLNQQRVAYTAGANGAFVTDRIIFARQAAGPAPFSIKTATIRHPALDAFSGAAAPVTIRPLTPTDANPFGDDFARIVDPPLIDGHAHTDRFGGLAAPQLAPDTLSHAVGAWLGVTDPKQAILSFGKTTLLGCLHLSDLISSVTSVPLNRPQITSTRTDTYTLTRMAWSCGDCRMDTDLGPLAVQLRASAIQMATTAERPLTPALPPRWTSECVLAAPAITLGIADTFDVAAQFASIGFSAASGAKTAIHAALDRVTIGGQLSFVTGLLQALPSTIFSDAPQVTVNDAGARIACPVALPSVALGVFALTNVAIDTTLDMPFQVLDPGSAYAPPAAEQAVADGVLSLTFNIATAEQPFTVGVGPFAGSGYFGILLTPRDVTVDGAIGFGGNLELNLIVVSGQVMAECGIRVQKHAGGDLSVGGFMHCHGSVSVLFIATVSLDVLLLLEFDAGSDSFTGQATVALRIDLLFFHKSVSFTLSKTFGGSPPPAPAPTGPPALARPLAAAPPPEPIIDRPHPLARAITEPQWRIYCGAFAA